jgi:hypothetical protein
MPSAAAWPSIHNTVPAVLPQSRPGWTRWNTAWDSTRICSIGWPRKAPR